MKTEKSSKSIWLGSRAVCVSALALNWKTMREFGKTPNTTFKCIELGSTTHQQHKNTKTVRLDRCVEVIAHDQRTVEMKRIFYAPCHEKEKRRRIGS